MSHIIDSSVKPTLKELFSLEHAKKAYSAGVAGAIVGAGTISISGIFADGKIDGSEVGGIIAAVGGGFLLAFFGAWLPAQTPVPIEDGIPVEAKLGASDALTPGDDLR